VGLQFSFQDPQSQLLRLPHQPVLQFSSPLSLPKPQWSQTDGFNNTLEKAIISGKQWWRCPTCQEFKSTVMQSVASHKRHCIKAKQGKAPLQAGHKRVFPVDYLCEPPKHRKTLLT
jgi:hypothetical protein